MLKPVMSACRFQEIAALGTKTRRGQMALPAKPRLPCLYFRMRFQADAPLSDTQSGNHSQDR